MTADIFAKQTQELQTNNIVLLQEFKTQTTQDKKVVVITKPLVVLRDDIEEKLGEPEDGHTSTAEPVEVGIPEKREEEMEIDQELLADEPELSVKSHQNPPREEVKEEAKYVERKEEAPRKVEKEEVEAS